MTAPNESPAPTIPDFQGDALAVAAYNDARTSYMSRESGAEEERTRTTFDKRRSMIRVEIDNAATLLDERKAMAEKALWMYATLYPLRVDGDTPTKPSFWEVVRTLGYASRLYQRAIVTAAEAVQAQSRRRRLEASEEELDQQLQRTLYLQADARKRSFEAPDGGLAAFHAQPFAATLRARVEEIKAERLQYAARLAAGDVPPAEQRDRDFAEHRISPLVPPFDGVTIVRVERYGSLAYFILQDLERKLYALAYDDRLEALIEHVVDVYWLVDSFKVRPAAGSTGWAMTITEHFSRNFNDPVEAHAEYRAARAALGVPRTDIPPMTPRRTLDSETDEADLIELLVTFAESNQLPGQETSGESAEMDAGESNGD